MNVGHIRKWYSVLSIVEKYRVQASHSKHHPVRKAAYGINNDAVCVDGVMELAYLVRGTDPLVCGRSSNKTGQHLTHTVAFSGPGS